MAQKSRPWFSSLFSIDRLFGFKERVAKSKRRKRSIQLNLEMLEDRTVPTIVFTPQFGPDSLVSSAPFNSPETGVMSSATVYLILWGPSWSQTPTGSQVNANTIINQATAVVNSTQLSILDQYGSDGKATFGGFYIDNSTPPASFGVATGSGFVGASLTTAENEISNAINGGHLPGPTGNPQLASAPIYAIVTDPNDSFDGNGNVSNGGVNRNGVITSGSFNGDGINMIGVGTGFENQASDQFEFFATQFSHELQEKMSEPTGRPFLTTLTAPLGAADSPTGETVHVASVAALGGAGLVNSDIGVGSEQLLVTAVDLAANTLTVNRASNGTTEAAHSNSALVVDDAFNFSNATPPSPPAGYGVVAIPPAGIPPNIKDTAADPVTAQDNWDQIADFEPETNFQLASGFNGQGYAYRLGGVNGVYVQAAYSAADQAFVVEDGNSEVFTLTPNWTIDPTNANNDKFDGTFDLTINGDQLANKDDSITISEDSAGGIQVNLDGQIANFDPGTATTIGTAIRSINVNGLTGGNTLTLDFSQGNFLSVMNPNSDALANGLINYNGGTGASGLLVLQGGSFTNEVDTATGAHSGVITLDGSVINYSSLSPIIDISTVTNLTIKDPLAGDTINIKNDPNSPENGVPTSEINGGGFEKMDFGNKTNVTFTDTSGVGGDTFNVLNALVNGASLTINGSGSGNTLHGPNQADTWNITTGNGGNITGLVNSFSDIQNLVGGTGADTFVFSVGGTMGSIAGGGGSDAIDGANQPDTWNITGPDAGNITGVLGSFTAIQNLAGGTGPDIFAFSVGGTMGTINGGGGNDAIDGANQNDAWYINGPDAGNIAGVLGSFTAVQNLFGGAVSDTFIFSVGGSMGSINGASSHNVIYGPNVNSTWHITGYNRGDVVGTLTLFNDVQYLIGGTGDDTFVFSPGAVQGVVNGGYGNNTVVGAPDQINAFDITGGNAGSVVGAIVAFGNIQNLAGSTAPGNTGTDVFEFFMAGGLAGHIAGGTGSEWLYYELMSMPIFVDLSTGVASRLSGGVTHLANSPMNVIGSSVGGDIIIGDASGGVLEGHNGGNTIEAGSGRTIIIGGYGKNYLVGGSADDLIIAGATVYDYDILTLTGFLTEWQSAKAFATRVYDLRTGTGQVGGHALILNVTVICPSTPAGPRFGYGGGEGQTTMVGGGGDNWFFTLYPTTIVDLQSTDDLN